VFSLAKTVGNFVYWGKSLELLAIRRVAKRPVCEPIPLKMLLKWLPEILGQTRQLIEISYEEGWIVALGVDEYGRQWHWNPSAGWFSF